MSRPVPLLGDVSLEFVQRIEHALDGGFVSSRIAGLAGELQQRAGRLSHRVQITGVLFGDKAKDDLGKLQGAAKSGDELTFSSDITSALDLQKVVITSFQAVEMAGQASRFRYEISLAESPPLPPPAQLEPFGGLGDFGLGDLGFDTSVLGDIAAAASQVASAVNTAMNVVNALGALSNLDGLNLGGFLDPMKDSVSKAASIGGRLKDATRNLTAVFSA